MSGTGYVHFVHWCKSRNFRSRGNNPRTNAGLPAYDAGLNAQIQWNTQLKYRGMSSLSYQLH